MIIALDTSTPVCHTVLIRDDVRLEHSWDAGRGLADGILQHLRERLAEQRAAWTDVTAIVAYKGPGSFTGLRIGLTVMNTVADTMNIPIVGETGTDWLEKGISRLEAGENDELVMPLYGREPNITKQRK